MRNKKLIIIFSVLLSVALLTVVGSVLFSVQHVRAYCANVNPSEKSVYQDEVLSSHGIKKGTSIFFVNENKVKENIESKLGNHVRVLNIERVFPNRIYINYVEVKPYLMVRIGTTTYYSSKDLRVMDGYDEGTSAIKLKFAGSVKNEDGVLEFSDKSVASTVSEIFAGFEELGYDGYVIALIEEIDLSDKYIVLNTREGVKWEIHGADNLRAKIRLALSCYLSPEYDMLPGSVLIVPNDKTVTLVPPLLG